MNMQQVGPWTRGIVNTVNEYAVPAEGLVDAVNCDIAYDGSAVTRQRWARIADDSSFRDIFSYGGTVYAVGYGSVGRVTESAFVAEAPASSARWTVADGQVYYLAGDLYLYPGVRQVSNRGATENTDAASKYGFTDIPGGDDLAYFRGRMLILSGTTLYWSEPFDFGTYSPVHNYLRMPERCTWIAAVDTGVYVGGYRKTYFLRGQDPNEFVLTEAGPASAPFSGLTITASYVNPSISGGADEVVVWFSEQGFSVGLPNGSVVYPQASNIERLPLIPRNLVADGGRIYAFAR